MFKRLQKTSARLVGQVSPAACRSGFNGSSLSSPRVAQAAFVVCVLSGFSASAQVLYGTLTGVVSDTSGALVTNAKVVAVEATTGLSRETQTNAEGTYVFSNLTPGTYKVTISAEGFGSKVQEGISLLSNTVDRVNLQLALGGLSQTVEVSSAPPALQTDRAETDYNISPQQIMDLPTTSTTGRNFQSLYKLVPGSTPPAEANAAASNPQRAQAVNVNGVSNASNTTRIDGSVDAYPWLPYLVAYLPPTDGIDSINVVTGSFNAEQGTAGGSAINVTIRNGTNKFHGSAWEYNSIAQFNAQAWQNRTGVRQKNILNEVGGAFGGYLVKNKLFFFADYDRVSTAKTLSSTLSVPTALMRSGDFNATGTTIYDPYTGTATGAGKKAFAGDMIPSSRFAPAAVKLLSNLPLPNTGAAGAIINNYTGRTNVTFTRQNFDGKLSWNPTSKTTVFGHYSASPNTNRDPQVFGGTTGGLTLDGGIPGTATGLIQNVGVSFTHVFTGNLLVDGNFGYTHQHLLAVADDTQLGDYGTTQLGIPGTNLNGNPLYAGIPAMVFNSTANPTYTTLGNTTTSSPFYWMDGQYTGNLNGTYTIRTHVLRFGGEYITSTINHIQPGSGTNSTPRGNFLFSGGITTLAGGSVTPASTFADFLLGQAYTYLKGVLPQPNAILKSSSFSFFAQDTWQATTNLTLNYGIRYEYYPLPVAGTYGTARYDPSVRTTVTDNFGTHSVGTVLLGGNGGTDVHANSTNHLGMIVPRFGASYRVTDKTVIRTGFGMTVDPDNVHFLLQAYPAAVAISVNGANTAIASTSLNPGLLSTTTQVGIPSIALPDVTAATLPLPATASTYTIPQDFRRGYIYSYNLALQQQLPANFVSTITYVGTHAVRQQTQVNVNASYPGGGNAGRELNTSYGANTDNTDIFSQLPYQGSTYNGLQTQLARMSNNRISTGIVYTFSKAENASDNGEAGTLIFANSNYRQRNWALAGYDRKHNFQWWTVVPFPFGADQAFLRNGYAGKVLGNWRLSTILSRVSGTPFNVLGSATLLNAPGNTQLSDRNYGISPVLNQKLDGGRQYLNYAAYSDVSTAAGVTTPRFGTSSRNGVRGPGIFNLDVSLKRSFPIHDNLRFELSADAFDVTNTPQFANPTANINTVSQTSTGSVNLGGFGTLTTSTVNRTMRLSGRLMF